MLKIFSRSADRKSLQQHRLALDCLNIALVQNRDTQVVLQVPLRYTSMLYNVHISKLIFLKIANTTCYLGQTTCYLAKTTCYLAKSSCYLAKTTYYPQRQHITHKYDMLPCKDDMLFCKDHAFLQRRHVSCSQTMPLAISFMHIVKTFKVEKVNFLC